MSIEHGSAVTPEKVVPDPDDKPYNAGTAGRAVGPGGDATLKLVPARVSTERMFFRRRRKVFCIGRNKTGTTSVGKAIERLGFKLGKQSEAELLIEDWARRDFRRIVRYCKSADVFQDVPFSLDYTYPGAGS